MRILGSNDGKRNWVSQERAIGDWSSSNISISMRKMSIKLTNKQYSNRWSCEIKQIWLRWRTFSWRIQNGRIIDGWLDPTSSCIMNAESQCNRSPCMMVRLNFVCLYNEVVAEADIISMGGLKLLRENEIGYTLDEPKPSCKVLQFFEQVWPISCVAFNLKSSLMKRESKRW